MTTKLEEVLAEEWTTDEWDATCVFVGDDTALQAQWLDSDSPGAVATRAAVAVLGKRALVMVLAVESRGPGWTCPVCLGTSMDHDEDCEWGRIVKAAKELG